MMIEVLKSKIHNGVVTGKSVEYEGSITIDARLMEEAGIEEYELVHVWNVNNGERIVTYAIKGKYGSGEIVMNGASARKFEIGDKVIIASFAYVEPNEKISPKIVILDGVKNEIKYVLR